jgi:hydrogenase maturation protease
MATPIVLIGIGNEYRSDDGVGLVAIRELQKKGFPNTQCVESNGDGAALIEAWANARLVVLLDAVSSGAAPGTIYRFDALTQPIPMSFSAQSTHAFGVVEAIELARTLHQLPPRLVMYGIEGKNFAAGLDLSSEVEQAMHELVERVRREVTSLPDAE